MVPFADLELVLVPFADLAFFALLELLVGLAVTGACDTGEWEYGAKLVGWWEDGAELVGW